jgi:hypothetical protein
MGACDQGFRHSAARLKAVTGPLILIMTASTKTPWSIGVFVKECAMDHTRYDRLAILFHWVMAALIFYAAAAILKGST